jgi:hypothetical protein
MDGYVRFTEKSTQPSVTFVEENWFRRKDVCKSIL